ncbi:MAG: hypothetical protein KGL17_00530 [Betaproteobacteria bacterium]|nr:hypothetical protein [Betaproteobacteria bacterium]MDE2353480.1 hypothetical protein [Betaproteobacteria bacterium]
MNLQSLPGLTPGQKQQLFQALEQRAELNGEERARYPVPELLAHSLVGMAWWALMQELYDHPLKTVLGLTATVTYPLWWIAHGLHRWF